MDETQAALMAETLQHTVDLITARADKLEAELKHQTEMTSLRLASLEKCSDDHEQRIRSTTDGVTQFKTWAGLAAGGSSILAIISFVKAFLGVGP